MIPIILIGAGAYLIAKSFTKEKFAKGGALKYYDKDTQHRIGRPSGSIEKDILEKVKYYSSSDEFFVGSFGWKTPSGKLADGYLYKLNDYDENLVKNIKLKPEERIFLYFNRTTAIGGMTPMIKINLDKELLYFLDDNSDDEIVFKTRGVQALWIALIEDKMADGGMMAKGGKIVGYEVEYEKLVDGERERDIKSFKIKEDAEAFAKENYGYVESVYESQYKMADGGETEEGVDLFEDYENIPPKIQKIIDKYSEDFEDGNYKGLESALKEMEKKGYTFEYYLDGGAYDLRKIGQRGKSYAPWQIIQRGSSTMAKGGMVVTSIKDIPNFNKRLDEDKITYRGLGMGKKSDNFYDLAGEHGVSIKVDGKEYHITDTEFNTFSRGADGKLRIRFDAPYRKSYASGGYMENGGRNQYDDYEMVVISKGLEKDGGQYIKDRYLVSAKDIEEAKKIATELWEKEMGNSDFHIVKVMSDSLYRLKYMDKYADGGTMANKGGVTFEDKVKSIKKSLLKGKKVSPSVQKDYGKTYSAAEAEESARRIVGSMTKKRKYAHGGGIKNIEVKKEDGTEIEISKEEDLEKNTYYSVYYEKNDMEIQGDLIPYNTRKGTEYEFSTNSFNSKDTKDYYSDHSQEIIDEILKVFYENAYKSIK